MSETPSEVVEGEVVDGQIVGHELERVEQPLARILVTPEEAARMVQQRKEVIDAVLKEGKDADYWRIDGTPKKSLLKPGAEKLQAWFGLGQELVSDETGLLEDQWFYAKVKVRVTSRNGQTLAEMIGWCDDMEKKRNGGPGSKWKGNRHTIISMAIKRAYIAAIREATGTSSQFTDTVDEDAPASQEVPKYLQEDKPIEGPHAHAFIQVFMSRTGKSEEEATAWLYRKEVPKLNGQPTMYWTGAKLLHLLTRPPKEGQPQPRTWLPTETPPHGETPTPSSTPTGESPPSSSVPPSPSTPTQMASASPGSGPSKELEIPPAMQELAKAMRAAGMPDAMIQRATAEHHRRKAQQDLDERGEWNVGQEPLDESPEFK